MKRIAVMTSGGDAPGMNAAVRAVVRTAIYYEMSVIGFKRGYNGMLMNSPDAYDDYTILTRRSVGDIVHRGGTFLMTARCPSFMEKDVQKHVVKNMRSLGIEGLIGIGGDGTFRGLRALYELGFPTVGIPGTIDNDLPYTDFTLGFDTAVNTACESINRIRETSDSHGRASLITVMGRNCGDIAVHTALACGAEFVMVPERPWSIEDVAGKIKWGVVNGKRSAIIVMAEGAFVSMTSDVRTLCEAYPQLSSIATDHITSSMLAAIIEAVSGQETRATVLGYTQRGGTPSARDRNLAARLGARAVELLRDDIGGHVVGVAGNTVIDVPSEESIGGHRPLNTEFMNLIDILSK